MTLGTKTLLGLGASFAFWCLLLYQANAMLLRPSFAALERRNLERNCERARKALADQALTLSRKVGDWTLWDDTYEFIESKAREYVDANLNPESLDTLDLDFMAFLGRDGQVVHIALRQEDIGLVIDASAVHGLLKKQPRLLVHTNARSSHHGLARCGSHLLLLASRPIHRSDLSGEARGAMIAGRILGDAASTTLSNLTQLRLQLTLSEELIPDTRVTASAERVTGTFGVVDVFGRPVATCSVDMPREITKEGESALRLLLVALLISGGLALLTTLFGIDRAVLRRLCALSDTIRDITATGDLSRKATVNGSDEISLLATSLNTLTAQLHETQQRLITANQARSQFLANVSHEVRTPVNAMLGFLDLLQDQDLPRGQHEDFVRTIRRNAQHLLTILNDLLDSAKIESGQMAIEVEPTDLSTILEETIEFGQANAMRKDLELRFEQLSPLPKTIATDATRLRQILTNLVGNALKFTERGSVRVVASMSSPQTLQVQVVDTGIGITREQQQRLFAPFVQADAATSRRFGGTGLGLVLSRNLARRLGGDVTMQSEPGVGSTFTLTIDTGPLHDVPMLEHLERERASREPTAQQQARPADLTGRRILVVDDASDNRRLLSFVLSKAGAQVDTAEDGRVGVDRAAAAATQGAPHDLIVMDMQMPVLDGYAATSELRQRGLTMPVLALTANALQSDLDACLRAGCDDYATKPIDRRRLLTLLDGMLQRAHGEPASAR